MFAINKAHVMELAGTLVAQRTLSLALLKVIHALHGQSSEASLGANLARGHAIIHTQGKKFSLVTYSLACEPQKWIRIRISGKGYPPTI